MYKSKSKYFDKLSKLNDYNQIYNIYIALIYGFIIFILTYSYCFYTCFYTYERFSCECLLYTPSPLLHQWLLASPYYQNPDLFFHPYFSSPCFSCPLVRIPLLATGTYFMYIRSIFIFFSSAFYSCARYLEIGYYPYSYRVISKTTNPLDPDNIFGLQFKFEGGNIKQIYLTLCSGI